MKGGMSEGMVVSPRPCFEAQVKRCPSILKFKQSDLLALLGTESHWIGKR